ncbi:hypothetical protein KIN20_012018 [Parelaphostrongylus tenuis]|uniref:Uncharacterized protein n=1 Tax=Parelaphostrongylus tenuis TaxID=148309 RepID=A0AAD5QMK1_PARTN|nr:hypothetical protein KIN20_012018 [Parelaphostrongylus tenuis]
MANWSRMMWQGMVNRAIRMLASGPLGPHFFSASGTVGRKLNVVVAYLAFMMTRGGLPMYQFSLTILTDKPRTNSVTQADGELGELKRRIKPSNID